ncbi:hypothetical protein [Actinoplanes sp. NBRC 101535]|uniref:hypothetical protein n=1 Tax=Actinoplanes sp. NBRC 101535 TaxID=3032196 RepID=UPI0025541592|nr:hypothetical protein [Actinoplanes sp. NBRC 101535]
MITTRHRAAAADTSHTIAALAGPAAANPAERPVTASGITLSWTTEGGLLLRPARWRRILLRDHRVQHIRPDAITRVTWDERRWWRPATLTLTTSGPHAYPGRPDGTRHLHRWLRPRRLEQLHDRLAWIERDNIIRTKTGHRK